MLNTSVRSANLRAILADDDSLRASVQEIVSVMEQIDHEDIRGFRLASIIDPNSPSYTPRSKPLSGMLHPHHFQLLCHRLGQNIDINNIPKNARFLKEVSKYGVCYGTTTSALKNSSVIFYDSPSNNSKAGITIHIFEYQWYRDVNHISKDIFFVVQELEPIHEGRDPYRRHAFGGFICAATGREQVISMSQIKSHFALTRLTESEFNGLIHVLPVDRVGFPLTW